MVLKGFPRSPVVKTPVSTGEGRGSIPGQRNKILHAAWPGPSKKGAFNLSVCNWYVI